MTYGLRSGTSLVSKTGRAGFDPSATCELPHAPLAQEVERWPHTPEVTVRLGQGVPMTIDLLRWMEWNTRRSQKPVPPEGVRVRVPP